MAAATPVLRAAVVGAGYWGPNLARNFASSDDWELAAVCDLDRERARAVARASKDADVETSVDELLARDDIDAVAVATPAATHYEVVLKALRAGKHVVVEKPLADTTERGHRMVEEARARGLVLMTDHTFCYTAAIEKVHEIIAAGELGEVLYVDSVRINLGLVQPDIDVFWDLAPHDLSIMDYVLPGGLEPEWVSAQGADPIGAGKSCVGYLFLPLPGGATAHVHVNWLSPTKIRNMTIGGSRRTLVWDDLNLAQRVSVFDRGVDLATQQLNRLDRTETMVSYRLGDTWSPALKEREALGAMISEFADSIRGSRAPATDGAAGLRVVRILEAATRSLASGGREVPADVTAEPVRGLP
ncbi:oxidoreductase [Luteimicrobium album]|uniref:Oxidoreductase n=1 Tax=Luteimicrobium album TaxID=1054550 RepID=A0ABQ6I2N3_9MICO|nr:Gfo/Idh/MocA family oxidoreductase [Luteimicrobium album]GMA24882.1 oxidoreductase [Luteimicrobium album]